MRTRASEELLKILAYARDEAMRTGDYAISTDHLFLGILRHASNDACATLKELGADAAELKNDLEGRIFRPKSVSFADRDNMVFSRDAQNALNLSIIEANIAGADAIFSTHLLLAVTNTATSHATSLLRNLGIDHASLSSHMKANGLLKASKVETKSNTPPHQVSILSIISSPDKIAS